MAIRCLCYVSILLISFEQYFCQIETCNADNLDCGVWSNESSPKRRYLLYDINPGEGFNLRRDVYMRIATLVKKLNDNRHYEWILVLPPWGPLYHWKTKSIGYQGQLKWSKFFNLDSLRLYVPVIELDDFLKEHGPVIDVLYYLQHYAEGWTDGVWKERADIRDCIDPSPYRKINNAFKGWFWGYDDIYAKDFHCLSIQGYSNTLKKILLHSSASVIMIDRAEVILHDNFGDSEYWMVRRSMIFSNKLISIGNKFRKKYLNSTDEDDKTKSELIDLKEPIERKAAGGPYISVHIRRQDFVKARQKEVPSIKFAAKQIQKAMKKLSVSLVFVASDASSSEVEELMHYIPEVKRFIPSKEIISDILDGGVAIVDQWICAHSKYFFGTYESTFSFRIQEEREILGFPVQTTFNRLCGDNETNCNQPSKWTIVF